MKVIRGNDVPGSHLPFSPAVESGGFVFVSGQASVDDAGAIVRGTFEEEMRRSIGNLNRVLAGAGLTLADVVQVRSYVANKSDLAEYNRLYAEYFPVPMPARTTLIGVLSDVLSFEIDVIAKTRGGQ